VEEGNFHVEGKDHGMGSPTSIAQFMDLEVNYDSEHSLDAVLDCGEVAVKIPGVEDVVDEHNATSMKRRRFAVPSVTATTDMLKAQGMYLSTMPEATELSYPAQAESIGLPIDEIVDTDILFDVL
jgi:hypothetical protein